MNNTVKSLTPGGAAAKTIIAPGDTLVKINGQTVSDILDYRFLSYDGLLLLELTGADGRRKLVRIRKREGGDLGIEFESFLMDGQKSCANNCVFCFIDQLPRGMRETLYYKDDDLRLSFLQGNYVTLTNLAERDIERIIRLRISPVNVSVHSTDPELRARLLGIRDGGRGLYALKSLARAGIGLNCQIVVCPGINDGERLSRTLRELTVLGRSIISVSVVPVGLTKHREGLAVLRPFDAELARDTVRLTDSFGRLCLRRHGRRLFYCADELYITAGLPLPPQGYYGDFPQLENGVGMMRLFITEFGEAAAKLFEGGALTGCLSAGDTIKPFSIATGTAAARYLTNLLKITRVNCARMGTESMEYHIYAVRNDFFGESVTVSGLVTGGDIIAQLKGRELGSRLFIPRNMLRSGESVFLDDVTTDEVSTALGVPVTAVGAGGDGLLKEIFGK